MFLRSMGFFPSSSNRILAGLGRLLNANILTAVARYGTITFIAADGGIVGTRGICHTYAVVFLVLQRKCGLRQAIRERQ